MEKLTLDEELKRAETPSPLPVGKTEFYTWAADIIRLAEAPDNDSMYFALATIIMQFPTSTFYVSKRTIVDMLKKGMANQVASDVYRELKLKQQEELKKLTEAGIEKITETTGGQ